MVMLGCACWNAVTTLSLKTFVSSGLYPCQKVTVTFCVVADWVHAAPRSTSPSSSVHARPILRPITPPSQTNSRIGNPVDCLLTCSPLDHLLTKPPSPPAAEEVPAALRQFGVNSSRKTSVAAPTAQLSSPQRC